MSPEEQTQAYQSVLDNLASQQSGLIDFTTQIYGAIGTSLANQQKLLDKATRPLRQTINRNLAGQRAQLEQVTQPIMLGVNNAIAEQGIQLAATVANAAVAEQTQPPAALSVRPLPVPAGPRANAAIAAARPPAVLAKAASGLADEILADTTEPPSSSGGDSSVEAPPGLGDQASSAEETVTNVVALRSCDLKAIVDALSRPKYNPFVDSVTGLPKEVADKLTEYYGADFAAFLADDPVGALTQLLASSTQAPAPENFFSLSGG